MRVCDICDATVAWMDGKEYFCCNRCKPPEPLSPQARAVLEDAGRLVDAWKAPGAGMRFGPMSMEEANLEYAVRAYRATRQPDGVRPEEAEPGTRFRFAVGDYADTTTVYVKMARFPYKTADSGYRSDGENVFYDFKPGDRIIPLPKEQ